MFSLKPIQSRIVIGPLFDPEILGFYLYHENIRCFSYDDPDIQITEPLYSHPNAFDYSTTLHSSQLEDWIQDQIDHWQAELLIWIAPGHFPVPPGIKKLKIIKLAIAHDWHLNHAAIEWCLNYFHYVFCDALLIQRRQHPKLFYWPTYSFRKCPRHIKPLAERQYDICFIGSLSHLHVPERVNLVQALLELSSQYRIKCTQGIFGDDYLALLSNSKIVMNLTQRSEMNLRAYEAAICGAVLFIEKDNLEISSYLTPAKECVLYDLDTLGETLADYFSQPELLQQIATNGFHKIQKHSYHHQFELLLEHIQEKKQDWHQQPKVFDPNEFQEELMIARYQLLSRAPQRHQIALNTLENALTQLGGQQNTTEWMYHKHSQLIIYLSSLLQDQKRLFTPNSSVLEYRSEIELVIFYLKEIARFFPKHPIPEYHLAWCYLLCEQFTQAMSVFQSALMKLHYIEPQINDPLFQFVMPINNYFLTSSIHNQSEWEQPNYSFVKEVHQWFPWCVFHVLGDYCFAHQDFEQAKMIYEHVLTIDTKSPYALRNLAWIHAAQHDYSRAYRLLSEYLTYCHLDYQSWLSLLNCAQLAKHSHEQILDLISFIRRLLDVTNNSVSENMNKLTSELAYFETKLYLHSELNS